MNPSSVKKFLDRGMGLADGRKDIALDPKELRQVLQRDLFGEEEELKVVAQVRKTKKKKNKQTKSEDSLLLNTKRGQKVRIQVVKYTHGSCVIKQTWKLEELHRIEFYEEESSDSGFTLYFDKAYNWTAFDTYQRNDFVARLWKLCEDNLKSAPQTSIDIMELRFLASEDDPRKLTTSDSNLKDIASSYKDLTAAEEKELENLLNSCVSGVTDIDELSNHLNKRLNELEEQNIYEIIESELAVKEVLNRLNTSFSYLDTVDKWLINYDSQLKNMQQYIEHIISKNNRMEVVARNQRKLLEEMERFLKRFQLDETYRKILKSGGLAIDGGLDVAIKAAKALDSLYKAYEELKPETKQMKAIKEKMEEFEVIRSEFAARFYQFIQESFSKIAVEAKAKREKDENFTWSVESHTSIFKQLIPYKDLIHWFKRKEDPAKFDKLLQSYSHFLRSVYKRSIKDFFSKAQKFIISESKDHKILAFSASEKAPKTPKAPALPKTLEKMTVDKIFYYILNVYVPIILAEQNFCVEFFDLTVQKNETNAPDSSIKDGLFSILESLFEGISNECLDIIETGDKLGHFYTLSILVYICQYTAKYESQCPFLVQILNNQERRAIVLFNKFIDDQVTSIKETQVSTKRCGIINWFAKFPLFVDYMEQCISGSKEVRTYADSTYHKLILSLFTWLNQLGEQDPVPKFKYITRLENFHCFAKEMTQRNVGCMAEYIQQATDSYKANRTAFIELIVKDKFKSLTEYFDGIDALLVTLPAEEIQFQQSHSKQALAKYNSKNSSDKLDKILSQVFKKVVKNLCIEEGLTTEVWDALTQYVVTKYKHFEDLVKKCYKGQQLSLTSKQLQDLCKAQVKKHLGDSD